jgi:O-antigen/teichoic acid export membrane protein
MIRAIGIQTLAQAFNAAVSFALVAFLGRQLGTDGFGAYAAILSLATVALVAIEGGWPTLVYRDGIGARAEARSQASLALGHMLLAGVALATIAAIATFAGAPSGAATAVALLCMTAIACANLVSARLRAQARFAADAGWQVGARVASAGAIAVVVLGGLRHPAAIFAAWGAAVALALFGWGRRELAPPRRTGLRAGYRIVAIFVLVEVFTAALLRGDVALYAALGMESRTLSLVAAATRYVEFAVLMFAPIGNVLLHRLRGVAHAPAELARLWRRTATFAAGAGLVALALAGVAREALMRIAFGEAFAAGAALLPLVLAALPLALANSVLAAALLATGRERRLAANLAASAVAMGLGAGVAMACGEQRLAVLSTALAQALLLAANLHALRSPRATAEAACASE